MLGKSFDLCFGTEAESSGGRGHGWNAQHGRGGLVLDSAEVSGRGKMRQKGCEVPEVTTPHDHLPIFSFSEFTRCLHVSFS